MSEKWWEKQDLSNTSSYYSGFKKQAGKSVSSFWSSRFDNFSFGWSTKSGNELYQRALNSISRSANLISNSDGEEKAITVRWSHGHQYNQISKNDIFISPDVVNPDHNRRKDWSEDERTDVLVGEALTESAMKKTASIEAQKAITDVKAYSGIPEEKCGARKLASHLWYSSEVIAAKDAVVSQYPGFGPYLGTMSDFFTDATYKANMEKTLVEEKPSAALANKALCYSMLHPEEDVKIPEEYQELIDQAAEDLGNAETSMDRAKATIKTIQRFTERWGPERGQNPPPCGGGGLSRIGMNSLIKNDGEVDVSNMTEEKDTSKKDKEVDVPDADGGAFNVHDHKVAEGNLSRYRRLLVPLRHLVSSLKNRLKLRNEELHYREHGLKKGDIDEGSIYKLAFSKLGLSDPSIFEGKEIAGKPEMAFILLIDESGSMGGGRIQMARDVGIVLGETLQGIEGCRLAILGHTAQGSGHTNGSHSGLILHQYYTPDNPYLHNLERMEAFQQNLDGYAIARSVMHACNWFPRATSKLLIHISDGQPAGTSYGGDPALRHIGKVSRDARRKGVDVIGIGIDRPWNESQGDTMYGENRWVILNDADEVPRVVSNLISRAVLESCRLR
tara:strand:+ start:2301 stop:4148 length:1848 start_codon:yes stop_codon:yes gene_type:complete